jgi:hypothetical protein
MSGNDVFPLDSFYFSEALQVAVYISVLTVFYVLFKRFK